MDEETRRLFEQGNQARLEGNYEEARKLLEEAVRACPDASDCWWALGHVMLNIGEFDVAIARFTRSVELAPNDQRKILDLAKSLEMLSEYDAAKPLLDRVVEIDPTTREAEEARKSLRYY